MPEKKRRAYAFTSLKWHLNKQEPFSSSIPPSLPFLLVPLCHYNLKLSNKSSSQTFPNVRFRQAGWRPPKIRPLETFVRKTEYSSAHAYLWAFTIHSSHSCWSSERTDWATDLTESLDSKFFMAITQHSFVFIFLPNHLLLVGKIQGNWGR